MNNIEIPHSDYERGKLIIKMLANQERRLECLEQRIQGLSDAINELNGKKAEYDYLAKVNGSYNSLESEKYLANSGSISKSARNIIDAYFKQYAKRDEYYSVFLEMLFSNPDIIGCLQPANSQRKKKSVGIMGIKDEDFNNVNYNRVLFIVIYMTEKRELFFKTKILKADVFNDTGENHAALNAKFFEESFYKESIKKTFEAFTTKLKVQK